MMTHDDNGRGPVQTAPSNFPKASADEPKPIDMVLFCPVCHLQHIDYEEETQVHQHRIHCGIRIDEPRWMNPPHKSHLCAFCKTVWRPADVPTNGVAAAQTRGKDDTWPNFGRLFLQPKGDKMNNGPKCNNERFKLHLVMPRTCQQCGLGPCNEPKFKTEPSEGPALPAFPPIAPPIDAIAYQPPMPPAPSNPTPTDLVHALLEKKRVAARTLIMFNESEKAHKKALGELAVAEQAITDRPEFRLGSAVVINDVCVTVTGGLGTFHVIVSNIMK
jgi:hypothetical protein